MDILFVLDCTASMMPWIHAARDQVRRTLDVLQVENPSTVFRVGLIVYRDYGDDERTVFVDLEQDMTRMERLLHQTVAEGGDDDAEDLTSALWTASHMEWSSEIRHVFVITDAPAHGARYHSPRVSDRFPDGDPDGRVLEDQVHALANRNVNMTFIRIHSRTDPMIEVMRRVYSVSQFRGVSFHVEDLDRQHGDLPPPVGLARHGGSYGDEETVASPDAVLSRVLTRAVTQSLSVYDPTD